MLLERRRPAPHYSAFLPRPRKSPPPPPFVFGATLIELCVVRGGGGSQQSAQSVCTAVAIERRPRRRRWLQHRQQNHNGTKKQTRARGRRGRTLTERGGCQVRVPCLCPRPASPCETDLLHSETLRVSRDCGPMMTARFISVLPHSSAASVQCQVGTRRKTVLFFFLCVRVR